MILNIETKKILINFLLPPNQVNSINLLTKAISIKSLNLSPVEASATAYALVKDRYDKSYETIDNFYDQRTKYISWLKIRSTDLSVIKQLLIDNDEVKDDGQEISMRLVSLFSEVQEYLIRSRSLDQEKSNKLIEQCLSKIQELEEELKLKEPDVRKALTKQIEFFEYWIAFYNFRFNINFANQKEEFYKYEYMLNEFKEGEKTLENKIIDKGEITNKLKELEIRKSYLINCYKKNN